MSADRHAVPGRVVHRMTFAVASREAPIVETKWGRFEAVKYEVSDYGDRASVNVTGPMLFSRGGVRNKRYWLYAAKSEPNCPQWLVTLLRQAGWSGRIDKIKEVEPDGSAEEEDRSEAD